MHQFALRNTYSPAINVVNQLIPYDTLHCKSSVVVLYSYKNENPTRVKLAIQYRCTNLRNPVDASNFLIRGNLENLEFDREND